MDDQRDERAEQAGQWAGIGMFTAYVLAAWAGV